MPTMIEPVHELARLVRAKGGLVFIDGAHGNFPQPSYAADSSVINQLRE